MTDILCNWLNQDVGLSAVVNRNNLSETLRNGYYIAEVLYKYGLQSDIQLFSPKKNTDAIMRNYAMLKPTLSRIGIDISPWLILEIKNGNHPQIRTLIYQLYIGIKKYIQRYVLFI